MSQVFNQGEVAVQQMAGEAQRAGMVGRGIQPSIVGVAIPFIRRQTIVYVGSTDQEGQLWLSILVGEQGFVEVPDVDQVVFNEQLIHSDKADILYKNIAIEPSIGVLFIEQSTRKRFRINGTTQREEGNIRIKVEEAYANCPKYIRRAMIAPSEGRSGIARVVHSGSVPGAEEIDWISSADTFYVASRSRDKRTDASHRGGNRGFIEVLADGVLRIPDYAGNSMFNTLGNIYENPNVGLLFVDVEKGSTLQLTGKGSLDFEQTTPEDLKKSGDTGRFWLFETKQWIRTEHHHQLSWELLDYSPFNP